MLTDRRSFLQTSVMSGCAAATGETVLRKVDSVSSEQGPALVDRMSWMNAPRFFPEPWPCPRRAQQGLHRRPPGLFSAKREGEAGILCDGSAGQLLGFARFRR